jgi:ParB-like chromosome segregation protein Spo0J
MSYPLFAVVSIFSAVTLCNGEASMADNWATKAISVTSLHLDAKNPRLGRETTARAPREIIQYLFEHDKAAEVAESIATRGYFPNEPLLAIRENDRLVVVEGNRRLAALKALREPGLLEGALQRQVERLSRKIIDARSLQKVPVTVAPNRKATDRQIAGRHIGTPVLAWEAENRASFILDKLEEGYDNAELQDELGFSATDIQKARQTRAIADMARSIDLPDEVRAKLENPRAKVFTTLARVFDSSVGREFLKVEKDAEHGLRGATDKTEFVRGFTKLVSDVALGKQSSRTLNKSDDIKRYFDKWLAQDLPKKKKGSFVPSDIIKGKSVASSSKKSTVATPKRSKQPSKSVLPRDFRVRFGNDRLIDIRRELVKLKREHFPNAGAVLLRAFFELSVLDYLERSGELKELVSRLGGKANLQFGVPTLKQMVPAILKIAKAKLGSAEANRVEKAIRYDSAAPFTVSDLHAFVHQASDPPSARDIWQFWLRTEPLFRLMLEQEPSEA